MSERKKVRLGRTGLMVTKTSFGAPPIQRASFDEAAKLLRAAYEAGINFFDTANSYTDSEEKIGYALSDVRDKIIIATKSAYTTPGNADMVKRNLELSLRRMKTDYIDILQFHNPSFCPAGDDPAYQYLVEMKRQGVVRHIGITNHRLAVAHEAVDSGLYALLQFPFSYLSGPREQELVEKCRAGGMGFVAMKGMAGGLLRDGTVAAAWMARQEGVVPIWGVQHEWELDQFLACVEETPALTPERQAVIDRDRAELTGDFCRGCGYCMPCPVGIQINQCARMSLMLRRAPAADWLSNYWQEEMKKIEHCLRCGKCASKCPYGLDTPRLLQDNWKEYQSHI